MSTTRIIAGLLAAVAAAPHQAQATEAAAGHYIPGMFALPMAGAIPPAGLYWNVTTPYYNGSMGRDIQVPVAGEIRAGLEATFGGPSFTGLWVPDVDIGQGASFAVGFTLPVQYLAGEVSLGAREVKQSQIALGDIGIAPRIGWKSGPHFVSVGLNVFAPTGAWDEGALDNVGMNYWTFTPNVSYTYFDAGQGLDLSLNVGVDFNTENPDTDYRSGAVAHFDAVAIKHFNERFAAGLLGSAMYQIEDDEGGIADRLDGFRGRSVAIGPIVTYTAGPMERPISIAFSWASEIDTRNRPEGNALYLSISGSF